MTKKLSLDTGNSSKIITLNGTDITVRIPKVKDAKLLQSLAAEADQTQSTDRLIDFLATLGFAREHSEDLTLEQFKQVIEFILGVDDTKK